VGGVRLRLSEVDERGFVYFSTATCTNLATTLQGKWKS